MKDFSTEEILKLVSLTLLDAQGVHYHWDPIQEMYITPENLNRLEIIEFYNQCHDEEGKFCSGPDAGEVAVGKTVLRDTDGKPATDPNAPKNRGNRGASLVDPNVGTDTINGLKGYDKVTGKPVPGSDAWLEAHGFSREIWESRPYIKFEADKMDPALLEAFKRGTPGAKQWDRLAAQKGQTGGYIMYKHPIPDSPYGPIPSQVRPNMEAVTNWADRKKTEVRLAKAKKRLKDLETSVTPGQLITEQKAKVKKAEINLERMKKATPEIIRAEAYKGLEKANKNFAKAKLTKDPDLIAEARKERNAAQREIKKAEYTASKFRPEAAVYHAQKEVDSAKMRLNSMQEDPKGFLAGEIKRQMQTVKRAESAYKGSAAKYLFTTRNRENPTPEDEIARIDIGPDRQNAKNLMSGKGRIYFAMEGSIKNDAILAAVKREDPTAAVVNVPSVTLWHNKSATEGEIKWFARTHGKDRQIVLIPDTDGATGNVNVQRQASALAATLKTHGAKQVLISHPPTKPGTTKTMDTFKLGSGVVEERKGIDDHLGSGRGTLGQLVYQTDAKIPRFNLKEFTRAEGNTGEVKLNKNALDSHEKMLGAISSLAGRKGAVQVSKNLLMQTSGITSPGTALSVRDKLQELGIIDVRYVFDKDVLWKSRKRVLVMPQKEVDSWVSQKVIKPLPDDLFAKDDYEASPIIVIKNPKYIVKEENTAAGRLSELSDWSPPKSYDGWRSPLTSQKDTTGISDRLVADEAKAKSKIKKPSVETAKKVQVKTTAGRTTAERLAEKTAPKGRKIVRTEAGAKRYGVPVGSLVPLSLLEMEINPISLYSIEIEDRSFDPATLNSMVLLSSVMSEEDIIEFYNAASLNEEFYNQCHDEDGKFCEGEDGPGRVRDREGSNKTKDNVPISGRFLSPIKTVAKDNDGVEVDGVQAKAVYEIKADDGQNIRLYDQTGKVGKYKDEILETQVKMHNLYPLQPSRNIVVTDTDEMFQSDGFSGQNETFAIVYGNNSNTYINSDLLGINVNKFKDGFQMPSAKTGDTKDMSYLLTHEYGHHVDFDKHSSNGYTYEQHPLYNNSDFKDSLSRYGKSDPNGIEAYAETFAEWHHSNGTTTNPAAIAMARYEGWAGSSELLSSGLLNIALENMTTFQKTPIPVSENGPILPRLVPEGNGITVIERLTEEGAIITGDFEIIEPTEQQILRADQIMKDVLRDLGMEG